MPDDHLLRRELREALARLDPRARTADTLAEDAGLSLARIDFTPPGENIWFSVLHEARAAALLPALIALAVRRWPADATLCRLAVPAATTAPPAPAPAPAAIAFNAAAVTELLTEHAIDPLELQLSDLAITDASQWLAQYRAMMARVAVVKLGTLGSGTGFLIGPDLLLTNWHVVAPVAAGKLPPSDVTIRFDYWRAPGGLADHFTDVALATNWLLDHAPWSAVDLVPGASTLPAADELDFAVLRLARPLGAEAHDGAQRGWVSLPQTTQLRPGQSLLILQHPNGHPLRLAFDGVLAVNANATRVRYRTNTLPGTSGSPCFDQNWTLAAVHHSGDPGLAPAYNEGIPAASIRALLESRGKVTLSALT